MALNLMLDFETLGTDPNTVVLSLGAVLFDETGIVGKKYFKFDVQDQLDRGRSITFSTLQWWLEQSKEAQEVLKTDKSEETLDGFCFDVKAFLAIHRADLATLKVWGNGATFDVSIFENLHKTTNYPIPHKFFNVMCYRTFKTLTGCDKLVRREGVHHNALDDAEHQAKCVIAQWRKDGK